MSHTFTDSKGRTWDLALDLAAARRVDKFDFSAITPRKFSLVALDPDTLQLLYTNSGLLAAIAFVIIRPQAEKVLRQTAPCPETFDPGTSIPDPTPYNFNDPADYAAAEEEFISGLTGPVLRDLRRALWDSLANFTLDGTTALLSCQKQHEAAVQAMEEEMAKAGPEVEEWARQEVRQGLARLRAELTKAHT